MNEHRVPAACGRGNGVGLVFINHYLLGEQRYHLFQFLLYKKTMRVCSAIGQRSITRPDLRTSTASRSLTYLLALGDVARRQALHDSCVVVSLLKAVSVQQEL